MQSFASDNNSGVHPVVMDAILRANQGHVVGYGDDDYTRTAIAGLRAVFGPNCDPYFTLTGTGSNIVALQTLLRPYEAVVCAQSAHVNCDEAGAPERHVGCKVIPIATTSDGRLVESDIIAKTVSASEFPHQAIPGVLLITNPTEMGYVYTPQEMRQLVAFAHGHGMRVHVDGARLANAAAALDVSLADLTSRAGVDAVSFGGTKNGAMCAEAVLLFNRDGETRRLAEYCRKQAMQLASKMRFVAVQFTALLQGELWLENARHANAMAKQLANGLRGGSRLARETPVNMVFARIPFRGKWKLREKYMFYDWPNQVSRFMTSFDTTSEAVDALVEAILSLPND